MLPTNAFPVFPPKSRNATRLLPSCASETLQACSLLYQMDSLSDTLARKSRAPETASELSSLMPPWYAPSKSFCGVPNSPFAKVTCHVEAALNAVSSLLLPASVTYMMAVSPFSRIRQRGIAALLTFSFIGSDGFSVSRLCT